MPFQFQCPNGHLLVGDESQGGQQCVCPTCQILFVIPVPAAAPAAVPASAMPPYGAGPIGGGFPLISPGGEPPSAAQALSSQMKEPEVLHIPCPQCKQVLESPLEMLDQEVICPHCQTQFCLRRRDSLEFKRKKQQEQEIRENRAGRAWLNWAIVVVVLVLLGLVVLIFSSGQSS